MPPEINDHEHRLSVIEKNIEIMDFKLSGHLDDSKTEKSELKDRLDELMRGQATIQNYQRKQQGFVAGIVFAITSVFAILISALDHLHK